MIDVPRTDAPAFQEPPLSWKPVSLPGGGRSAIFVCPNGHVGSLVSSVEGEGWTIADDGTVSPSIDCSPNGCDFHDFVRLLDWKP